MNSAMGMVMAIENTPHGLFASARTTTSASTAIRIVMMAGIPIKRGPARRGAEFVADHLSQGAATSARGDPQHQVVLHTSGERRADNDPDGARQVPHLRSEHRTDEWAGSGDGGEVMAEHHASVGRHVIRTVVEDLGRRGAVVAGADDLHLDQPRIEPEGDEVRAARSDDHPHRVDRLATDQRDDRPGDGADHGDHAKDDLVPEGDGGAVDDCDGWQVVVGADVADPGRPRRKPYAGDSAVARRAQYRARTVSMVSASAGLLSSR